MEFPELGQQCALSNCQVLDFLPFKCDYCNKVYCKEHYIPEKHSCTSFKDRVKSNLLLVQQYTCSFEKCKATSPVEINCIVCGNHFCLAHRYHGCIDKDQVTPTEERKKREELQKQFMAAKEVADKQVESSLLRARQKTGTCKTAMKVQLMRLKSKAVGPKTVPVTDRVYFSILPPLSAKASSTPIFVARQWSLGRAIDSIANNCNVINKNNVVGEPSLRLFNSANGQPLCRNLEKKIEELLHEGDVAEGETLILEYISENATADHLENTDFYKQPS